MRVEAELRRDEEERRYRREAAARAEERQAKEAARAEERKIEADERKREAEARAFREVMMMCILGTKKPGKKWTIGSLFILSIFFIHN